MTADSASISYSINVENTATFTKLQSFTTSQTADSGSDGAQGATGPEGPNFDFLSGSLDTVNTTGGLSAGLLMTSNVFGFHKAIAAGDGTNAQLSDFTSFLDSGGSFYLGGNSSGASDPSGGYFAWNNTDKSLLISGSNANVEVDKFFLGNPTTQFISGSNGNIKISGDVEFEGRNQAGSVVFFDNFAQYSSINDVLVTDDDPKADGNGVGYYLNSNNGEKSLLTGQGEFSGKTIQFGNNSGNDEVWISSNKLIPFNENSLYEIEFRIKFEVGSSDGRVYGGITAYGSDGTTKVNVSGNNDFGSQHYFAMGGLAISSTGTDWVIYKGYFKGTDSSGNGGQHHSETDPGTVHNSAINGYIAPMFLAHFDNQNGRLKLDYIKLTEVGGGGSTKISGDALTTGTIKSNNLDATNGSQFKLDDGTFKLGGTSSPKLEWDGTTLSVEGNITVSNPNDFADPGANVTTEAVFEKFGGVSSPITSDNYYLGNLVQNLVTQTDGGTSFSGIKFEMNGSSNGWTAGFATKTTFTSSLEPIATIDVVLNEGVTGTDGAAAYPPYQMFGFSDIDSASDVTTANNYQHLTYGIYINRKTYDGSYYNTISVRENNGAGVGASDYYTVNGITPDGTNGPWVSGQDTFIRFTIQPKTGGGAIYKAFRNGNFLVPIWSYVSSTYEFTGNQSFFWSTYWGESNSNRKELIVDQIAIGAAPPAGTVISGDGITAGTIVSTNLNADSGSQLLLDDGSMKLGGTTSPGFEVTTEGFVSATNLVEKEVIVTNDNSGSYFETFDSTKTRLILDGSLGGDVTMNMELQSVPPYRIWDIQFPSNVTDTGKAKLELTIMVDGVEFEDSSITSGFTSFGGFAFSTKSESSLPPPPF